MPRSVGLLQTIAVSVGVAIGSGIFRVPATVAAQLQAPGAILVCWILGGIIALCGALTVAELAGALPRSGGIFAYLLEAYGPLPAFLFGWTELVVIRAAALGRIGIGGCDPRPVGEISPAEASKEARSGLCGNWLCRY